MAEYYLIFKALHIISVISWMAGMFYLPRLFVYHCQAKPGSEMSEKFKIMEKRLLRIIINPAMFASLFTGIMLMYIAEPYRQGWFHAKGFLLVLMFLSHGIMARCRRKFEKDENKMSEKFYRILNEVPTVLMVIIVFLAVMKPF